MHKLFGWERFVKFGLFSGLATLAGAVAVGAGYIATASAIGGVQWEDVYDGSVSSAHYSNTPRQSWHHGNCTEEQGELETYGKIETTQLCVTRSASAALASFEQSGGGVQYALKKSTDTTFHHVTNLYAPAEPVLLSNNTLLTVSLSGMNSLKFISLEDIQLKLQNYDIQTGSTTYSRLYTVDESQAVLVRDSTGSGIFTRHIAASQNNRFAAVEVYGSGIALIDLLTGKVRLISKDRVASYGSVGDIVRMGVSNDGKKILVTSDMSKIHKLYLIDDFCGRDNMSGSSDIDEPCDSIDLTDSLGASLGSRVPFYVEFNEDSQNVSVLAWSLAQGNVTKLTVAPDANKKRLSYLALGDSYSSGEGDTERDSHGRKYYRSGTDVAENTSIGTPKNKCHISTRSYPYKLAVGMDLALDDPKQWDTVTCSGAVTWDIKAQGAADYKGQGDTLKNVDHDEFKKNALNRFTPGQQKQIAFVKKYKPRAVTLTIGGNDVGFGEKIKACATSEGINPFSTCSIATNDGRYGLGRQIINQYDNLFSIYTELRKASAGRTKIYVLGYPQFINGNEPASCGRNIGMLDAAERKMIHESVKYLNDVIQQAARAAGVKYIDIENSLAGGRLCDDGQRYVTGVAVANGELQDSFHPNARGHHEMAMAVWDSTSSESLLDYEVCAGSIRVNCPDANATKDSIATPSYFASVQPQLNTHYQQMTPGEHIKSSIMDIFLNPFSFKSNSIVNIVMRSEPTNLGSFTVNNDGSLEVSALIPGTLPAGYHTLIVTGESPDGEQVRYEQIVQVVGADPEDTDEDGTPDAQQACGPFMAVSGVDADNDGIDDACDPMIESVPAEPTPSVTPTPSPTPSPTVSPNPEPGSGSGNGSSILESVIDVIKQIIGVVVTVLTAIFKMFKFGW